MQATRPQVQVTDRDMERVYRLVPSMGHKRAIAAVAGEWINPETDEFEPFIALQVALTERYEREMAEFIEAGGY